MIKTKMVFDNEIVEIPEDLDEIYDRCVEALKARQLDILESEDGTRFVLFENHAICLEDDEDNGLTLSYLGQVMPQKIH